MDGFVPVLQLNNHVMTFTRSKRYLGSVNGRGGLTEEDIPIHLRSRTRMHLSCVCYVLIQHMYGSS
jgi:hypothetical protein